MYMSRSIIIYACYYNQIFNAFMIFKKIQGYTRVTEVKNHLTIARGEGEGIVERRVFRNYYKGHMDKTKGEGGSRGGKWVWLGWGREVGRNMQTTVIEQQ